MISLVAASCYLHWSILSWVSSSFSPSRIEACCIHMMLLAELLGNLTQLWSDTVNVSKSPKAMGLHSWPMMVNIMAALHCENGAENSTHGKQWTLMQSANTCELLIGRPGTTFSSSRLHEKKIHVAHWYSTASGIPDISHKSLKWDWA